MLTSLPCLPRLDCKQITGRRNLRRRIKFKNENHWSNTFAFMYKLYTDGDDLNYKCSFH